MKTKQKKEKKIYPLNQCALYNIQSKKRLCELLFIELDYVESLLTAGNNYRVYIDNPKPIIEHEIFIKKPREIQALKPKLEKIHKRIFNLFKYLEVPDYLHSAVKGRSYRTNAEKHVSANVIYRVDIKKFYQNISKERIYKFFCDELCCSPDVSGLLAEICCYKSMLPTGSSISPILSFLANRKMFDTLFQYALSNGILMTVYVDDVILSGDNITYKHRFEIDGIIVGSGYKPHKKKCYKVNNIKLVTGLVVGKTDVNLPSKRRQKVRLLLKHARMLKPGEELNKIIKTLQGYASEAKQFDSRYAHFIEINVMKLQRASA